MSDLVKFQGGGLPANPDDLAQGLQNISSHISGAGGIPFLRLGKDGIWIYGQDNVEVEEDSLWAVNPYSIQHGYACWGDNELLDEVMVPFNQAPPAMSTLQDFGYPWRAQTGMHMQCISGEDKGQTVYYKGTSIGMQNAVKDLTTAIVNQIKTDPKNIVPVLLLDTDSYSHKKYGKTYVPILEIETWVSMESGETENSDDAGDAPDEDAVTDAPEAEDKAEDTQAEKPEKSSRRRRRGKADEAETETTTGDEKPASSRRRRRRA